MSSQNIVKLTNKVEKGTKVKIDSNEYDYSSWPYLPDMDLVQDWLVQKDKANGVVSQRVINRTGKELHKIMAKGYTVDEVLEDAYEKKWKGIRSEFYKQREGDEPLQSTFNRLKDRSWADRI